jgi:hypothetical protein
MRNLKFVSRIISSLINISRVAYVYQSFSLPLGRSRESFFTLDELHHLDSLATYKLIYLMRNAYG